MIPDKNVPVITIDGAGGTGKGTVGALLAQKLRWHYLDSGALYRALAFAALKQGISLENEARLASLADTLNIQFIENQLGASLILLLDNENITDVIRTEEIGNCASKIGAFAKVREALLQKQRSFAKPPGLITDGRDMGTIVFPNASLKIFLTASPKVRALRRFNQLKDKGIDVNLGDLVKELKERDKRDKTRIVAPLQKAQDAVSLETDKLSINEVFKRILLIVNEKKLG